MTLTYSGDLVRRHDRDRFLSSLFAPVESRSALWALYAFNYEIARTREVVSNTTLGLIRLQWWRDAIDAIYQGRPAPDHVILADLADAIRRYDLDKALFERLLYAREFDLEDTPPGNLQGLENYADFTSSPLLELALAIARSPCGNAGKIATAYAMTGLLRAVPAHAAAGHCMMPGDVMARHGLTPDDLFAARREKLPAVVEAVARRVETLLNEGRGAARLSRVTATQAKLWLAHLRKNGFDPYITSGSLPFYELRLWFGSL